MGEEEAEEESRTDEEADVRLVAVSCEERVFPLPALRLHPTLEQTPGEGGAGGCREVQSWCRRGAWRCRVSGRGCKSGGVQGRWRDARGVQR